MEPVLEMLVVSVFAWADLWDFPQSPIEIMISNADANLTDVANDCVRMGFLVACCLYNYFGGSIINQHHWLNDLYKKKEKKEQSFWNFFEMFFDNLTEKVQQQIDNVQKEKTEKGRGKKHWKDPTLGLRHTILWCKSFLLSTHKSVVCSPLWSFTLKNNW